jgi:UDP-N-acetylmuramate dehydrogenase
MTVGGASGPSGGAAGPKPGPGAGEPSGKGVSTLAAELAAASGIRPRLGEPLAPYTTMRVGGPADLLAVAKDVAALAALARWARQAGLPLLIVGRGSNLVVADAGFRGLAIVSRAEGYRIQGRRLIAEAGLPLARAATLAGRAGLAGIEFGLAIPGTVGGAVWANAGAHGSDVASILEWARVLRQDGTEAREAAATLELAYRHSRLKSAAEPGNRTGGEAPFPDVVLEACFLLRPEDEAVIDARHDEIRRWRRAHQPLSLPSAGSVFRNPQGDSAGRLIEAAGLKGRRAGGARISEKHANFIVNDGSATAADVRRLAEEAKSEVARKFGVELVYEVQFAGDWSGPSQEDR